jgi:hypothetical protein
VDQSSTHELLDCKDGVVLSKAMRFTVVISAVDQDRRFVTSRTDGVFPWAGQEFALDGEICIAF